MQVLLYCCNEQYWNLSLDKAIPAKQISCASESVRNLLLHGLQLAINTEPCPNRYDSYIVTNSGSTFAYSRCDMTSDMDSLKRFHMAYVLAKCNVF